MVYMKWIPNKGWKVDYFGHCERCGKEFPQRAYTDDKYCSDCASLVKREKSRERIQRLRQKEMQKRGRATAK